MASISLFCHFKCLLELLIYTEWFTVKTILSLDSENNITVFEVFMENVGGQFFKGGRGGGGRICIFLYALR